MAIQQQTRQIGEREITSVQLDPVAAYLLLAKVGKVLIPAVIAARGVSGASDAADLMPAVTQLFDGLTPELAEALLYQSLASTSVVMPDAAGNLVKIDLTSPAMIRRAFAGDLKSMLLAMKFALEVNYASFFAASGPVGNATPTPSP